MNMKLSIPQRGFTLLEIMVVVAIIGILLAAIVPNIVGRSDEARVVKARTDIHALENAMDLYRLDNGFYPSQDQGLQALLTQPNTPPVPTHWKQGGYIKRLPQDPWGNPYQYRHPGVHSEVDIFSMGTAGLNATTEQEIGNW